MTRLPSPSPATAVLYVIVTFTALSYPFAAALGSGATIAIASDSSTVCGIVSNEPTQSIRCYRPATGQTLNLTPNTSFSIISGGVTDVCGIREGGDVFICWNWSGLDSNSSLPNPKRVYRNDTVPLRTISVGENHICGLVNGTGAVKCWRSGTAFSVPSADEQFVSVSSGSRFSCGVLANSKRVRCWGSNPIAASIENGFVNISMETIEVGGSHACGFDSSGFVICRGNNESGQLDVPFNVAPEYYTMLSLGSNHSCAIRSTNHTVVCWGGGGQFSVNGSYGNDDISFESIVSGSNFTCGLITTNLSITCWGPGWQRPAELPLSWILPGPCVGVQTSCPCGVYSLSQTLCSGSGHICSVCPHQSLNPPPPLLQPPESSPEAVSPSPPRALRRGLLAFAVIGSVGIVAGICTLFYWLWKRGCFGHKKIHNSVQPTITRANSNGGALSNNSPPSRSSTLRRQASRVFGRQRSGTSSMKHNEKSEEFSFQELAFATRDFALENKIGAGSFGVVYKGMLPDGRHVAIKRGEMKVKKFQEKESAFDSELAFLSRVHHKHLVRLVGFCHEMEERLLVYEFMKHGALHDHLHDKANVEKSSSLLNSWKMRIKIALDASRGIEYLHNYAVPPIIHRDIKSSNILLDANWTARVSDFGLSLLGPDDSNSDRDMRPSKAAGTVGYIDPEYYGLNVLTVKSDVYGFGVVLLELLIGKRAIFKNGEDGGTPVSLVDYAVPVIMSGELGRILDKRVGAPEINEAEAVELVGYTAMYCVSLEGKDRPTMADIVGNLERALELCDESHGSISSGSILEL